MKGTGIFGWIRLSKRTVFSASIILTILFFVFLFNISFGLCGEFQPGCHDSYHYIALIFFWAPFLFLFSLITYPLEKKIFNSWTKFALPWLVFSSVMTYLAPLKESLIEPDWKGVVALSLTILFCIVSVSIIIVKSVQVYRRA